MCFQIFNQILFNFDGFSQSWLNLSAPTNQRGFQFGSVSIKEWNTLWSFRSEGVQIAPLVHDWHVKMPLHVGLTFLGGKEGKKSWACLEKLNFCAPEYYRAGTRMAAQQQQKTYNRPLHFFPYKIAILLSPKKSYWVYLLFFYYTFSCQTSSVHRGIR